jgi:hypothetical protein
MRRRAGLFGVSVSLFLVGACQAQQPPAPEYRPATTIRDIMGSMVDPNADILWDSVATIINASGVEEKQPRTDEEWATIRRSAIQVVEATNLLLIPSRRVARPGEKAVDPVFELEPDQIQKMIDDDRMTWVNFVGALYEQAKAGLDAIDAKDAQTLMAVGEKLDDACENCHLKYWYPEEKAAEAAAAEAAAQGK